MNKEDMLILLHQEVVPALGCTEPVCVAVAAADAAHAVGGSIQKIELSVSRNIYKNGMFVGIPGFERIGLKYAAALGAYIAQPEAGLEIMRELTEEITAAAVTLVEQEAVSITIAEEESGVYVHCTVWTSKGRGVSIIRQAHTNIILTMANEQIIYQKDQQGTAAANPSLLEDLRLLQFSDMRTLAASATEEDLAFLWEGVEMNQALADYGVTQNAGIGISGVFSHSLGGELLGDSLLQQMLLGVASAIEARLDGCPYATMSSAGSGSKGIAVILPVAYAAKAVHADRLHTLQALAFAHLVNSYLNSHIGKLSAICSCATASATAASAAMTWLFGGSDEQISWAVRNMTGTVTGMICDGGKVGCALKLSSATTAGLLSAILAVNNIALRPLDGICAETPEKCADNMGRISNPGMLETDKEILQIMLEKAQQHEA